jgi:hypothetical protein
MSKKKSTNISNTKGGASENGLGGVDGNTTLAGPAAQSNKGKNPLAPYGYSVDGRPLQRLEVEEHLPPEGWKLEPSAGLTVDYITVTFKHRGILNHLLDVRELNAADERSRKRQPEENDYADQGLKVCPTSAPFWKETFRWFEGATVSIGALGGTRDYRKKDYVMLKLGGKALAWIRQHTQMKDMDLLLWIWQFIKPLKEPTIGDRASWHERSEEERERGHFTRIDWTIDYLPGNQKRKTSILKKVEETLCSGRFTSTWDRTKEKSCPKFFYAVEYEDDTSEAKKIIETITIGNRKSDTFVRVYDKRREMKAKGFKDCGFDWERFEMEKKGPQAHASVKKAIANLENWQCKILGLFKRYTNFKGAQVKRSRIKREATAAWYQKLLNSAEMETLKEFLPIAKEKDFRDYRRTTIKQCSKRLFKCLVVGQVNSEDSVEEFFQELFERALNKGTDDDDERIFKFLHEEFGEEMQEDDLQNLTGFIRERIGA